MSKLKHPHLSKVYEALSAVADGRCTLVGAGHAEVMSSDRTKKYTVRWSEDWLEATSDDNLTRWQGRIGYPIIAALLSTNRISYDASVAALLVGIPWKRLNDAARRDYDQVVDSVVRDIDMATSRGNAVRAEAERIHGLLATMKLLQL